MISKNNFELLLREGRSFEEYFRFEEDKSVEQTEQQILDAEMKDEEDMPDDEPSEAPGSDQPDPPSGPAESPGTEESSESSGPSEPSESSELSESSEPVE